MYRHVELTIELFRIYLRDDSEKANIAAIDALTHAFDAIVGALFYVNAGKSFRFCLAGTMFPINVEEGRWREIVEAHTSKDSVRTFSNWVLPGFDTLVKHWIAAPFAVSGSDTGYAFLGKDDGPWIANERAAFSAAMEVVSELVEIRHKRDLEAISRLEAERTLAKNERRMSTFFESSHDMIYTTDENNRFTGINQAGLKLFGVSSREEVIGRPFSDFLHNGDDMSYFIQRMTADGYVADHEIVLRRADGTLLFCLETSHAVRDQDGKICEIQGFIKDISDRIRNERELWKMNLELSELNLKLQQTQNIMVQHEKLASIGQLAAGVAHEINNPLGFLKSNQGMLKKYFDSVKAAWDEGASLGGNGLAEIGQRRDLPYIFDEAAQIFAESDEGFARIVHIVSNLMSFSRMGQTVEKDLYDVNAGIESTIVVAWNEIKYVADVSKNFAELPKIYAHGGEINQVVLNILVNAAQAIESQKRKEKGHIAVSTALSGPYIAIVISDDGPGIPKEILSRVFDPFFTTKEPGKGTGLGLSISYDIIVSKHKGKLSVESEPGRGTTFRIHLPVAPMDE